MKTGPSLDSRFVGVLILDFPVSRTVRNKFLLFEPGVVAHAYNPSIWESEVGRLLEIRSLRPAWAT